MAAGLAAAVAALAAIALMAAYLLMTASLPRDAGVAPVRGLTAEAFIERDALGVPRIHAAALPDALRAQGFVHAQSRYFQMDLFRRSAAGELAALVGDAALGHDRAQQAYRLRRVATEVVANLPNHHREWLTAYTDGVNAGLADLGARPPEYLLLGTRPAPWSDEDSVLVVLALYELLASHHDYELPQAVMEAALPPSVVAFLTPKTSRFDSPVTLHMPPADDHRELEIPQGVRVGAWTPHDGRRIVALPPEPLGSNQWAAGGARTASGRAMLANDPHLRHGVPATFHRIEMIWPDGEARGVGVPGIPGIVIGATAGVAWGVTVSYADQSDWVVVETAGAPPGEYRVPGGSEPFEIERARIAVHGGDDASTEIRHTRWGPVAGVDGLGRPLALKATWLRADGLDLALLDLLEAHTVADAMRIVERWSGPSLSWVFADAQGQVGWAVNGPLPTRRGFDGTAPRAWTRDAIGWVGRATPPRFGPEPDAVLAAANNRVFAVDAAEPIGFWPMPPFRARRIADVLGGLAGHDTLMSDGATGNGATGNGAAGNGSSGNGAAASSTPGDDAALTGARTAMRAPTAMDAAAFAALQLDTRAQAYDIVREIALEVIDPGDADAVLRALRARVAAWGGDAAIDDTLFDTVRRLYTALMEATLAPLLQPAVELDPSFVYRWPLADEAMRRVLDERPAHLLPAGYASWRELLRDAFRVAATRSDATRDGTRDGTRNGIRNGTRDSSRDRPLIEARPWGDVNRLEVAHPLAGVPVIGRWLTLPDVAQPGSAVSVRVATPRRGAVIRAVIAPGAPEQGLLQLAGGQSGHPLSRHFDDQLAAWAEGAPVPFLAGHAVSSFTLAPSGARPEAAAADATGQADVVMPADMATPADKATSADAAPRPEGAAHTGTTAHTEANALPISGEPPAHVEFDCSTSAGRAACEPAARNASQGSHEARGRLAPHGLLRQAITVQFSGLVTNAACTVEVPAHGCSEVRA